MSDATIEQELNSLRSKLAVEIDGDIKQVEVLKKRIEKNQALLTAIKGSLGAIRPDSKSTGYGAKAETVRQAIQRVGDRFNQSDIEKQIAEINPEMEINRASIFRYRPCSRITI